MHVRLTITMFACAAAAAGVSAPVASALEPLVSGGASVPPVTSVAEHISKSRLGWRSDETVAVQTAWQQFADRLVADHPRSGADAR